MKILNLLSIHSEQTWYNMYTRNISSNLPFNYLHYVLFTWVSKCKEIICSNKFLFTSLLDFDLNFLSIVYKNTFWCTNSNYGGHFHSVIFGSVHLNHYIYSVISIQYFSSINSTEYLYQPHNQTDRKWLPTSIHIRNSRIL